MKALGYLLLLIPLIGVIGIGVFNGHGKDVFFAIITSLVITALITTGFILIDLAGIGRR